ncbi:UNVERIFIED_CONTAM: hypothetical protein K2H54_046745 [Gekko kuhli]
MHLDLGRPGKSKVFFFSSCEWWECGIREVLNSLQLALETQHLVPIAVGGLVKSILGCIVSLHQLMCPWVELYMAWDTEVLCQAHVHTAFTSVECYHFILELRCAIPSPAFPFVGGSRQKCCSVQHKKIKAMWQGP